MLSPGPNGTLHGFSAVCWYTGKSLFERLGAKVPVGLLSASVGGSPIEAWIAEASVQQCGAAKPTCDVRGPVTLGGFYASYVEPCAPYTLGIWPHHGAMNHSPNSLSKTNSKS